MQGIKISNSILYSVNEASSLGDSYITFGLVNNLFVVLVQNIRGYVSVNQVEETNHPKFVIRLSGTIAKEALRGGYITVHRIDNKVTEISTYSDADCLDRLSVLRFPSSYSDEVEPLLDLISSANTTPVRLQKGLASNEVYDLLLTTGTYLNFTDTHYYSSGNGISFYIPIQKEFECITLTPEIIKIISKLMKGDPELYYNESKKTYILKNVNTYFTWRGEYNVQSDLGRVFEIEPLAEFDLSIPMEMPMVSNSKFTKSKVSHITTIYPMTETTSMDTTEFSISGSIKVRNKVGAEVKEILLNSYPLKYLISSSFIHVKVFKKFIRVEREYATLDIACDIILQ